MRYKTLGRTGIEVSELCLGSMTWGTRNSEAEAHAQIDAALDRGVNFIDTAEMYPTYPVKPETCGRSEEIIGSWVANSGRRGDVVIATKVVGPNGGFLRDGKGYDGAVIATAIDASLTRLQTDVIDLYQLHWPDRGSYHFRKNWDYDPSGQDRAATVAHMREVLEALARAVSAGKIRAVGLSNESAWGTMMWLGLADEHGLPRMASIQNEYSLLARLYDTDLAEVSANEDIGLLAFTPMVAGLFSDKHAEGAPAPGTRLAAAPDLNGRITPRTWPAVRAYREIAKRHGLDPCQMALAWTLTRPFMTASIFGATDLDQLDTALGAADLTLTDAVMDEISATHRAHPMPY